MPQQNTQPRFRPVIRVFVSSTFSDLKHERNALQAQVFPRLEQLCAENGFQFQAIDLRWGVSSEAGLDHRTMRICFDELHRAQEISPEPNFLVLLGNRYGWRPLPEAISHAEFEQLVMAADSGGEIQTPIPGTHGKNARQVLCDWYRCDENVVVPDPSQTSPDRAPLNYLLQPRTQNLGDGGDYKHIKDDPTKDSQDWIDVQQVLWRVINVAFPAESLDHRFDAIDWAQHVADVNDRQCPKRAISQIARFQASATEQEIWCGALSAVNSERHVIACFREIDNRADFAPADAKDFFDVTEEKFDVDSAKRQSDLKKAIEHRLGQNALVPIPFSQLKSANAKVVVDASEETIEQFCDDVENRVWAIIQRQIKEYWGDTEKASAERAARELKIEQREHERFGRERGGAKSFVGRETQLQAIRDYLQDDSPWPLVVHGASGCGKTALMWRAFEEIQDDRMPIIRLIGTTPHSSDVRSLLRSLCQKLRERHSREGELPTDIKALGEELQEHFRSITPEQPLILFLDALDQLSDADNGRMLNWIPAGQLPPHVKLVVSCLSDRAKDDPVGQPFAELTRRQLPAKNMVNLDALSEDEARTLLFDRWLRQAGREVSDQQQKCIEQVLKSKDCRQPIYLKLLFEEARLWHSYDAAPELGESVPAILDQFLKRLKRPENHHPLLVERVLGYLAASRHGLAENEILEVLFADPEYKTALDQATEQTRHELPASATRIPIAIWSRLRFDLAPYLTERAAPGINVLTFYHRQVAEWALKHSARSSDDVSVHSATAVSALVSPMLYSLRLRLADWFETQPISLRTCDELPWLLRQTESFDRLRPCLLNVQRLPFMLGRNQDELRRYWVDMGIERTMGDLYLTAFERWAEGKGPVDNQVLEMANRLGLFLAEAASFKQAEHLYRTALSGLESEGGKQVELSVIISNLAVLLKDTNQLKESEQFSRRALILAEHIHGPSSLVAATRMSNLAILLQESNQWAEAEHLLRHALAIDERILGEHDEHVARDLNNLGQLLALTARFSAAEDALRRAVTIFSERRGPYHSSVATALGNLAGVLSDSSRPMEAIPLIRQALAIEEQSYGPDHPQVAIRLNNLAQSLRSNGQSADAEAALRRALSILERTFGPIHPRVATAMSVLGDLLTAESRWDEAEQMLRQAIQIAEQDATEQRILATLISNLAGFLIRTHRLAEAEPLLRRSLEIDEMHLGTSHVDVARDLRGLGEVLQETNRAAEAEALFRRALSIDEAAYGKDNPYVADDLRLMATLFKETGRIADAEKAIRRGLAIMEASFDGHSHGVGVYVSALGRIFLETDRIEEALPLLRRSLDTEEAARGPNHPDVGTACSNLAQALQAAKRHAEAEPLLRRALDISLAVFGDHHPTVARDLVNMANLLCATQRLGEAEAFLRRAVAIDQTAFGPEHPEVATDFCSLVSVLRLSNRAAEAEPFMARAVRILAAFREHSGHEHPNLRRAIVAYHRVLMEMGLQPDKTIEKMAALGPDVLRLSFQIFLGQGP